MSHKRRVIWRGTCHLIQGSIEAIEQVVELIAIEASVIEIVVPVQVQGSGQVAAIERGIGSKAVKDGEKCAIGSDGRKADAIGADRLGLEVLPMPEWVVGLREIEDAGDVERKIAASLLVVRNSEIYDDADGGTYVQVEPAGSVLGDGYFDAVASWGGQSTGEQFDVGKRIFDGSADEGDEFVGGGRVDAELALDGENRGFFEKRTHILLHDGSQLALKVLDGRGDYLIRDAVYGDE